jgi:L-2-hydroxyglutarate oxidase LhgO
LQGREIHGVTGLLNLFGIDSPGLTSCLAIADEVARHLE